MATLPAITDESTASTELAAKLAESHSSPAVDEDAASSMSSTDPDEGACGSSGSGSSVEEEDSSPQQLQAGPPPPDSAPQQLQPGLPSNMPPSSSMEDEDLPGARVPQARVPEVAPQEKPRDGKFQMDETLFIFDWDDTVLPSTWVQTRGLRLDAASQPTSEQREILAEVAVAAGKTLRLARQHGTVVLVTNAERGWIELSCQKFLPTLSPMLENVKMVSARTAYECAQCPSPLDWKLCAFDAEIKHYFGLDGVQDPSQRKNVLSLGDSVHEREALWRATSSAPNCHAKSLKFVERPDVSQLCKQHELISNSFDQIVHQEGDLDLCIRCP